MRTCSGRAAVRLAPLVAVLVSCGGGTQDARTGEPLSAVSEAPVAATSPEGPTSGEPASGESTSGQPVSEEPTPGQPASEEPTPKTSAPSPVIDGAPARPGAPYDIEAFDNLNGPYGAFLDSVAARCPEGVGPDCLIVVPTFLGDETVPPETCEVTGFAYDPEGRPADVPEADRLLQRGTRVEVQVTCEPDVDPEGVPGPTDDPGTTAPGTTAPGTTAPGTTAPGTTAPGTTAPGTATSPTAVPAPAGT